MSTDDLIRSISQIGMASLSQIFGGERLERLGQLGVPMVPSNIASALFQEQGFDLLRRSVLREQILNQFSRAAIEDAFGDRTRNRSISEIAKLNWGTNSATEAFLTLFKLSLDEVFVSDQTSVQPKENTSIDRPLFNYQNNIRRQLNRFLIDDRQKKIIAHMPTGSGKTRTTMELVSDFIRQRHSTDPTLVVWMAHSDELCEQAVQTFRQIWSKLGSEDAEIIRFWGGLKVNDIELSRPTFLVTSFQSCHSAVLTSDDNRFELMAKIRSECDLLVVDEAHKSTAPTYRAAIDYLCNQKTKLIGLTATPGRHHVGGDIEETAKLANFYDNNKITIDTSITGGKNPIEYLQERKILSSVQRYSLDSGVEIEMSQAAVRAVADLLDMPSDLLRELGNNSQRTARVAATTLELAITEDKQTIVFCPSKQNAVDLALLLEARGCSARAITGETIMLQRRKWIEDFKAGEIKVLTNFGVLTTGFDAPNIEAVVVARPTTSVVLYSQMVGRGLRGSYVGGTEYCTLVDVIDNISNLPEIPQAFSYFDEHFGALND